MSEEKNTEQNSENQVGKRRKKRKNSTFAFEYGDFTYDLLSIKHLDQSMIKGKHIYEEMALRAMEQHYAFYGQLNDATKVEGYVTRNAVIHCDCGNTNIRLDAYEDHGVIAANSEPVLTCDDCQANINIYRFGLCAAEEKYGKLSALRPSGEKEMNEEGIMCYRCMPVLAEKWKQKGSDLLIGDAGSGEFTEALKAGAYLTCRYGGLITIIELAENCVETEKNNYLITLAELDEFEFFMGVDDEEREEGIEELNRILTKYEINTSTRIAFFMGQVRKESYSGKRTLEKFDGDDPEEYFNNKYSNSGEGGLGNNGGDDGQLFRGAGYLQLTGRYNYGKFSEYIGDESIMTEGYRIVGGVYNRDISTIKKEDVGVINIGKYAWESAGWYWSIWKNLNESADLLDGRGVAEAIRGDDGTYLDRNKYTNQFYEILTGELLGLPE